MNDATTSALHSAVADAFEREQVPWLERLVNQPSHTLARRDVERAASLLDRTARNLGLDKEAIRADDSRFADHRVYTSPAAQDARSGILIGHVDTVFPRSSGFLEFSRDGDKAMGPGVVDMKGGLSVIFFALHALKSAAPEQFASAPLRVAVVTDEELGSPTSRAVYQALAPQLDWALDFEPGRTEDKIVTARKGTGTFTIEVTGVPAHSGNHHAEGVNAIHALALLIPRIEALTDYKRGLTVNVGLIEGGTSKNTVPPSATCVIDTRIEHAEDAERVTNALHALVANPLPDVPDDHRLKTARFELTGAVTRMPMEATADTQALRLLYEKHAQPTGLKIGEAPLQGGGSDANLLAAEGVPCIDGLGPYGKAFHSKDEWCSLESLRWRTQTLACFLAEKLGIESPR